MRVMALVGAWAIRSLSAVDPSYRYMFGGEFTSRSQTQFYHYRLIHNCIVFSNTTVFFFCNRRHRAETCGASTCKRTPGNRYRVVSFRG